MSSGIAGKIYGDLFWRSCRSWSAGRLYQNTYIQTDLALKLILRETTKPKGYEIIL